MKTLIVNLPPKHGEGAPEAVLTFVGTDPDIREVFKLRLYCPSSAHIHFYSREEGFSWGGPNQSDLSVIVTDEKNKDRAQVALIDTVGLCEISSIISVKINCYTITFPDIYNWIQVGDWAIPIP